MIKCVNKGIWTCISRSGKPKKSFPDDKSAISAAKIVNDKDPKPYTKLVAYKCSYCSKYHLLSVKKRLR